MAADDAPVPSPTTLRASVPPGRHPATGMAARRKALLLGRNGRGVVIEVSSLPVDGVQTTATPVGWGEASDTLMCRRIARRNRGRTWLPSPSPTMISLQTAYRGHRRYCASWRGGGGSRGAGVCPALIQQTPQVPRTLAAAGQQVRGQVPGYVGGDVIPPPSHCRLIWRAAVASGYPTPAVG